MHGDRVVAVDFLVTGCGYDGHGEEMGQSGAIRGRRFEVTTVPAGSAERPLDSPRVDKGHLRR